jgi:hypothetical protein
MSFENQVSPIANVHNFINESNVVGWSVTFVGDQFTNATIICNMEVMWNEVFFYCTRRVDDCTEVIYDKINDHSLNVASLLMNLLF